MYKYGLYYIIIINIILFIFLSKVKTPVTMHCMQLKAHWDCDIYYFIWEQKFCNSHVLSLVLNISFRTVFLLICAQIQLFGKSLGFTISIFNLETRISLLQMISSNELNCTSRQLVTTALLMKVIFLVSWIWSPINMGKWVL